MATQAELQAKIDKLEVNMTRLDAITNGNAFTDVTIDSGTVPTIAKFFKTVASGVPFATLSALTGNLNYAADTEGRVYNDGNSNGVYKKIGASGSGSWQYVGPLPAADLNNLNTRVGGVIVGSQAIINDRINAYGGGKAVYIPNSIFAANDFQSPLLTGDSKLVNWYKVTVTNDTLETVSIYYDKINNTVGLAVYPTIMPNDPKRYYHLVTFYGDKGYSSNLPVVFTSNTDSIVVGAFRPFVFDAPKGVLKIPQLAGYTPGGGGWGFEPPTNQVYTNVTVDRAPADTSIQFVWLDIADILKNGPKSSTALHVGKGYSFTTNPPVGGSFIVMLGTIFNEMFHPAPGLHAPVATVTKNQCGVGKEDNDLAKFKYGSTAAVNLKTATAIALGHTRAYSAQTAEGSNNYRTYYGDLFDQPVRSGIVYTRFYVETDSAGNFGTGPLAFVIDESGSPVGIQGINVSVTRRIGTGDFVREYEGWFRIADPATATKPYVGFWVGMDYSPTANVIRLFGLQYAVAAGGLPYVSEGDYPRRRETLGGRLEAIESSLATPEAIFEPVIPDRLYFMDGRQFPIYPDQMLDGVSSRGRYRVVLSTSPTGGDFRVPVNQVFDGGDGIMLAPEKFTNQAVRFDFVDTRGNSGAKKGKNINIRKVTQGNITGLTKRVLCIGDSITDWNGTMTRSIRRLNSLGSTITTIGTLQMGGFISGDAALTGEARSGKEFSDFINMDTDKLTPVDNTTAAVNAYLAMDETDTGKRSKNPFIRTSVGGDVPDRIFNGYIFDLRFYLNRFSYSDPDLVYIALGTNDISQQYGNPALAKTQILNGVRVMALQTRLALPNAKIVFGWHSLGRDTAGDIRWRDTHLVNLRYVVEYLRSLNDPNIYLLPAYCTISRDMGFPYSAVTNSLGLDTNTTSDVIHYGTIGTDQFGEMGAIQLAGILTNAGGY